nr:hypothetical protein [Actinomycetales bacterium]
GLLWILAALLLAFLLYVAWREKERTGSWASGVSAAGRTLARMARSVGRAVGRMFGGRDRRDDRRGDY